MWLLQTNLCTALHLSEQPHRLCDVELRAVLHKLGVQETASPRQHIQLDEQRGERGKVKYGRRVT